jgi:hypothetical protein
MTTIDNILFKIEKYSVNGLPVSISHRDKKILINMAKMVKTHDYITESQANLTVKILKENLEHLNFVGTELITSLKSPSWARLFKKIEKIRKISTSVIDGSTPVIEIEATYKKELKKVITDLQKDCGNTVFSANSKVFYLLLTEKNLVKTVDALKKYNFEKSEEIADLYNKIKSVDANTVEKKFNIEHTDNEKLKKMLIDDVGVANFRDPLFLNDRKIKFQYSYDKKIVGIDEDSLLYKIATRKNNQIFVDPQKITLLELTSCLNRLQRSPTLIILDEYNIKSSLENLKTLKETMDSFKFRGNVGVYFRFNNIGEGESFNKLIAEYGYNKKLDQNNKISILSNGKIPKFFLKNDWYPKSVIFFTNSLRNNKTSVYCNKCDLVIYYTPTQPIIGNVDAIL